MDAHIVLPQLSANEPSIFRSKEVADLVVWNKLMGETTSWRVTFIADLFDGRCRLRCTMWVLDKRSTVQSHKLWASEDVYCKFMSRKMPSNQYHWHGKDQLTIGGRAIKCGVRIPMKWYRKCCCGHLHVQITVLDASALLHPQSVELTSFGTFGVLWKTSELSWQFQWHADCLLCSPTWVKVSVSSCSFLSLFQRIRQLCKNIAASSQMYLEIIWPGASPCWVHHEREQWDIHSIIIACVSQNPMSFRANTSFGDVSSTH